MAIEAYDGNLSDELLHAMRSGLQLASDVSQVRSEALRMGQGLKEALSGIYCLDELEHDRAIELADEALRSRIVGGPVLDRAMKAVEALEKTGAVFLGELVTVSSLGEPNPITEWTNGGHGYYPRQYFTHKRITGKVDQVSFEKGNFRVQPKTTALLRRMGSTYWIVRAIDRDGNPLVDLDFHSEKAKERTGVKTEVAVSQP